MSGGDDDGAPEPEWFACVTHVGSNYAKLTSVHKRAPYEGATPSRWSARVHLDALDQRCRREPDPEGLIARSGDACQARLADLLARVKQLTDGLAVTPSARLAAGGGEVAALALRDPGKSYAGYTAELALAKAETLPALFREVEAAHREMAAWLSAPVLPLKAKGAKLDKLVEAIDDRVFSVELYAGLSEQLERVRDGEPAPLDARVHLMQRRCYMDEECLARYEAGGMELRDVAAFDAWLGREANLTRLLPFPRCVVAFRVRRRVKDRPVHDFGDLLRVVASQKEDMFTFLYVRNGEQLWRLRTGVDFGEHLFPDGERSRLTGRLWAKPDGHDWHGTMGGAVVSDDEYRGMVEAYRAEERRVAALKKTTPKEDHYHACRNDLRNPRGEYVEVNPDTVYFDDFRERVAREHKDHNRVALVLQGLLDRSPCLHPHPPWQLWTGEGAAAGLELVYDATRALVAGAKPDFAVYRASLNRFLAAGSVTLGQERAWLRVEAAKEDARRCRSYRGSRMESYEREYFRPYGDPGPGQFARVVKLDRKGRAHYAWEAKREGYRFADGYARVYGRKTWQEWQVAREFRCPVDGERDLLLCADAYTPGDYRLFFDDPRTRGEYLRWAPLLLECEEYAAGNREVGKPGGRY